MDFITESSRIYASDADGRIIAEVTFHVTDGIADIDHVFVAKLLRGRNIASQLVKKAVEKILSDGNALTASCSYASLWLLRHPEYNVITTDAPVACRIDGRH